MGLSLGGSDATGPDRFDTQYWTANTDPSDRYVQSLPGTGAYQLRPDHSGYGNLVLAGDWTDCGINAGCIEAAVVSGLQAANELLGRPRWDRIGGLLLHSGHPDLPSRPGPVAARQRLLPGSLDGRRRGLVPSAAHASS